MKYNKLIPELAVSNLEASLKFYINILGFKREYERKENKFVFLSFEGSQIMLDEGNNKEDSPWYTGKLEYPRGRGIHFQFEVEDIKPLIDALEKNNYELKEEPKEYWFRKDDKLIGMKGFLVQDPDGYLLMFNQDLGAKLIKISK